MAKKIYLLLIIFITSTCSYAANFSVAPTRFEINIDKVATNEVYVLNNTSQPLRIETYFESDVEFGKKYNLNSSIAVFPKVIAIKPGAKQVVRFRVKPGKDLEAGEYKSYIVFREVPPEIKSTSERTKTQNAATNVAILTELGISIYGHFGEEIIKGSLENFKVTYKDKILNMWGTSTSEGNTSLKFRFEIEDKKGNILAKGNLGNSSRNGKRNIGVSLTSIEEKEIKIKVYDQTNKIYYNKSIKL